MKRFLLYLFVFSISLLSIFSSGVIDSQDGFQFLAVARNIYYGKGPTAPPEEYSTRQNIHMTTYKAKNENWYSLTGLGYSFFYLPSVAITDLAYKYYHLPPPIHFPLENDWLILFTASFTNAFIGGILFLILFLFFIELKLDERQALLMTFISVFTTNLWVYTKHSMVHMLFATLIVSVTYFIRLYARLNKPVFLILAGFLFGLLMISYNPTFILTIPPLVIYYVLTTFMTKQLRPQKNKSLIIDTICFFIGLTPFLYLNNWFETARLMGTVKFTPLPVINAHSNFIYSNLPIAVFIEGLWSQLFSPGRSYFIYSPIILLIFFFWHRIKRTVFPELWLFLTYFLILVLFYSTVFSIGSPDQGISALWHGEGSWGPRYLSHTIPLGMLVVGFIFKELSRRARIIIFFPLCLLGLSVEFLGILMPYQIKFHELEKKFRINGTEYTVYTYSNLLPRYTPLFMMGKKLIKLINNFPKTLNHGFYNVRLYDGIDFPFNVGEERWRSIEGSGYISFDNAAKNSINTIQLDLINHPLTETKQTAKINLRLNGKELLDTPYILKITERKNIVASIPQEILLKKNNKLVVSVYFQDKAVTPEKKQLLGLISMKINGDEINKETIDVPYVSALGTAMGYTYNNWGGSNKDLWRTWDIHSQTFERLPDFWWIRNLYYWDIPKKITLSLFGFNILILLISGIGLTSSYKKLK